MRFNALTYLKDKQIPYAPQKNGWNNIRCPLCDDGGTHGGFSANGNYNCWRCGYHPQEDVIMALERISYIETYAVIGRYLVEEIPIETRFEAALKPLSRPEQLRLPPNIGPLTAKHKLYLTARRFNPDYLEETYGLLGTGPIGPFCHRVIIPIYFEGIMVNYQGRDITGKSRLRYRTADPENTVKDIKDTLYNYDTACKWDWVVVVEGVFDAWRMGEHSVATFGTGVTKAQIKLLTRFKKIAILFDPEAQKDTTRLMIDLNTLGIKTVEGKLPLGNDPADRSQLEANRLVEELEQWKW